ncbi:unnamed protein product, partial [Tetraodon nigroviridis]
FGVPESPASFLKFFFKMGKWGGVGEEQGPPLVKCRGGKGSWGEFFLVETFLVLVGPAFFLEFRVFFKGPRGKNPPPPPPTCRPFILPSSPLQLDKRKDWSSVDIKSVLLDMRKYRMGLIQTPEPLRFSYMAVLEGARHIRDDSSLQ